jgi:predicted amidohydrolase
MSTFTAGLVQLTSGPEIAPNLETAAQSVREAAGKGADLVLTPENTPILEPDHDSLIAKVPGPDAHPAVNAFAEMARTLEIWLLLGSTAVKVAEDRLANRSYLFRPDGTIAAQYDKIHMFDVDIPDGQSYFESKTFRPGEQAVLADLPWARLGLSICYDVRFPALYRSLAQAGAQVLTVPAAFTEFTGQAHWHTLLRARAIETGCVVLAPAQCGEHAQGRRTYGHSLAVAPWGEILADGGTAPGVTTVAIDTAKVDEARGMVSAITQDRPFAAPVAG